MQITYISPKNKDLSYNRSVLLKTGLPIILVMLVLIFTLQKNIKEDLYNFLLELYRLYVVNENV